MTAVHASAALAVVWTLESPASILVLLGVALSAAWCLGHAMLRFGSAIASFEIMPDGTGCWTDRRGGTHGAGDLRVAFCGEYLFVIGFGRSGAPWRWLVLTADSAAPEALRSLRLWARWRPQ